MLSALASQLAAIFLALSSPAAAAGPPQRILRPIPTPAPARASAHAPERPAAATRSRLPLAGIVVGIDPGHNGRNGSDPSFLTHQIWNGRAYEDCDTTGTATDGGYTEASFNWNVATYLTAQLRRAGAKVVLTRTSNNGLGPCVNTRARIIDRARANVAVDIHGDGGPAGGRGFAILLPVADGPNNHVIRSSYAFARILRGRFRSVTGMPYSTYDGTNALQPRNDLAGLNLTTVPKVLIECGNMRNATDARLLSSRAFQRRVAAAMRTAIIRFLGR